MIRFCLGSWHSDAEAPLDHAADCEARARADGGDEQRLNIEVTRDDGCAARHRHHLAADEAAECADDDGDDRATLFIGAEQRKGSPAKGAAGQNPHGDIHVLTSNKPNAVPNGRGAEGSPAKPRLRGGDNGLPQHGPRYGCA